MSHVNAAWAAWEELRAGNARVVAGAPLHPSQDADARALLVAGQHPIAAVLSCSDSRVPPELLFDRGFGELFVVRDAGPVFADAIVGSLEYAVAHLSVPLIVILTHQNCGAINAARAARSSGATPEASLPSVIAGIARATVEAAPQEAATVHAEHLLGELRLRSDLLRERVTNGHLGLVAATYALDTGVVAEVARTGD